MTVDEFVRDTGFPPADLDAVKIVETRVDRNEVPLDQAVAAAAGRKQLPDYLYPTMKEMRAAWRQYPEDHLIRRLILECVRTRRMFKDAEDHRRCIDKVWREDVGGEIVAMYQLRILLNDGCRLSDW
ncbi:hypothetical protein AB4851_08825 [Burkholderia sp. 22PA0099]|uniref:hypothetical protein n=1 Tax=Burkholderia sp. 22PA0099 TaxID=3237372 RepID=UPI0039C0020C